MKTIIFDLGDVCVRGLRGLQHQISEITGDDPMQIMKVHLSRRRELFRGEITEEEFWQHAINHNYPQYVDGTDTLSFLKQLARQHFTPIPGTLELVAKLKNKGHTPALLSDHVKEWIPELEKTYGLPELFERRFYSFQYGMTKHEPRTFKHVLKQLNADPNATLFIDDKKNYLESAKEAGIKHLHQFQNAKTLEKTLTDYKLL